MYSNQLQIDVRIHPDVSYRKLAHPLKYVEGLKPWKKWERMVTITIVIIIIIIMYYRLDLYWPSLSTLNQCSGPKKDWKNSGYLPQGRWLTQWSDHWVKNQINSDYTYEYQGYTHLNEKTRRNPNHKLGFVFVGVFFADSTMPNSPSHHHQRETMFCFFSKHLKQNLRILDKVNPEDHSLV